jgi:hypothetical protein
MRSAEAQASPFRGVRVKQTEGRTVKFLPNITTDGSALSTIWATTSEYRDRASCARSQRSWIGREPFDTFQTIFDYDGNDAAGTH